MPVVPAKTRLKQRVFTASTDIAYTASVQIVFRGRSADEAQSVHAYLTGVGIAAHISDTGAAELTGGAQQPNDGFRVLVDNRCLDQARRALQRWQHAKNSRE